jgi:hypothetical protein
MRIIHFSKSYSVGSPDLTTDPIHVFSQFFLHRDPARLKEIQFCLHKWCENPAIDHIHLLNERLYTAQEMGMSADHPRFSKISQTVIGHRIRFSDIFAYIRLNQIPGYHVLVNSDIAFDTTLGNLRKTDMHTKQVMFAQLRFEYNSLSPTHSRIFGPRFDSQDTWIFHARFPPPESAERALAIEFGKPGCDNKLAYLATILGYEIVNDPFFIKTFHVHANPARDYTAKDAIREPWAIVVPAGFDYMGMQSLGISLRTVSGQTRNFQEMRYDDNRVLYEYLARKVGAGERFLVPRISGHENNFAVFGRWAKLDRTTADMLQYFRQITPVMKNNAGIRLSSMDSIIQYSNAYLDAFDHCDVYAGWEPWGGYLPHIAQSHDYIKQTYGNKRIIWASALDVFHYIHNQTPWTWALRGKRILIISPLIESIKTQVEKRTEIYAGVDLFPDCSFVFLKPPQTQGAEPAGEFGDEMGRFCETVDRFKGTYDIALVSCGGYANPICSHIYRTGHSAMYIGGVLQMYFGILGNRWLKDRPDILRLFMNQHWTRPKAEEKPKGHEQVEGGCYW